MAAPKLTTEQRETLVLWLAAGYDSRLIRAWLKERKWPDLTRQAVHYYRDEWREEIEAKRKERLEKAVTTGLALKEERVARLANHADELDEIKWVPGEKGRLWNEKAWRETLDDIAREMGQRKAGVELTGKDGAPIEIHDSRAELAARLAARASRRRADSDDPGATGGDSAEGAL